MNLDFLTYLNWIFYIIIGLAVLMGFLRGMKKTLFTLITMAIFYVVFFVTVGPASKWLWTLEMPWLGGLLSNFAPELANFTSFSDSLESILQFALGDTVDLTNASQELLDLATGIGQFVLKIVYTILYFTVILILYKVICLIIGAIFFKTDKGASKNRGFGALFGVLNGVMAVFVMLIMMGGMMSVGESMLNLLPESSDPAPLAFPDRGVIYEASYPIVALADEEEPGTMSPEMQAMLDDFAAMIEAYNKNLFVSLANKITAPSLVNPDETVPMHLNLFDSVLSFEYNEQTVAFRYELAVLSEVALIFMNSDFVETEDISDLTGEEIRLMFAGLGRSELIVSLMPLGIEIAADYLDTDLPISKEELYAIDFKTELPKLGEIAGALFDIMNGAGIISGSGDVEDIVIDGDFVRDLFQDMSESTIIVTVVEAVLVPMLDNAEDGIGAIIKVPADLDWEVELVAIGLILKEIFDADITFSDLTDGDSAALLRAASSINLDVLLESGLMTETLINILSGNAGIEGLDMLEIPSDIDWRGDDKNGELRNILVALEALLDVVDELNFNDITLEMIADLTDDAIDDIFGSRVLVATISTFLLEQDLGDTPLVIPDSVFDVNGYITATEMKAVAKAIALIMSDGLEGAEFKVEQALSMSSADINKFLDSQIVAATVGKLIYDLDIDMLTMPSEIISSIDVDDVATSVVNKAELILLLKALAILELDDFDSMTFDATLIEKFSEDDDQETIDTDKMTTFLASKIIHSSVSSMILDLGEGGSSVVLIPSQSPEGVALVTTTGITEYLDGAEISALFQALLTLDIENFDDIDLEDTSLLLDNLATLIESSILHATISDQILEIGASIIVPYQDSLGQPIRISQAETTYIDGDELIAFVDAVDLFGFLDPASFTNNFSLAAIDETAEQDVLLTSAIMHATISATLLDMDQDDTIQIPMLAEDGTTTIRFETGPAGHKTEFVQAEEIKAMLNGLTVLGIDEVDDFSGTITLSNLFASQSVDYLANQNTLLASSTMQATISKQLLDLADSALIIPDTDVDNVAVLVTVGTTDFITKMELKAIINSVDVLGLGTDITAMDGSFTLANINDDTTQNTLLASAAMHATISNKLFEVDDNILFIPEKQEDNLTLVKKAVGELGFETDFVVKEEVKALINSLILMEYSDLSSFSAEFELDEIFANAETILLSATLQAMFSNRLLNDTGGALIVPNQEYVSHEPIRIVLSDVTYIQRDELLALIQGLDDLGLSNFATFTFTPANIFLLDDFSGILASEILQATISNNILDIAKNENEAPEIGDLIVPNYFRQSISVGLGTSNQVEADELEAMLESLKLLGILDFGDDVQADDITSIFLDDTQANTFLASGSLHITVDNMVKKNPNIGSSIPALAKNQTNTYDIADVTKKLEIIAFVQAANALTVTDFTNVDFSFATIAMLDEAHQDTVLTSMTVRNYITADVVSASLLPGPTAPFDPLTPPLDNDDYEEGNVANFLLKQSIKNVIDWYYPE